MRTIRPIRAKLGQDNEYNNRTQKQILDQVAQQDTADSKKTTGLIILYLLGILGDFLLLPTWKYSHILLYLHSGPLERVIKVTTMVKYLSFLYCGKEMYAQFIQSFTFLITNILSVAKSSDTQELVVFLIYDCISFVFHFYSTILWCMMFYFILLSLQFKQVFIQCHHFSIYIHIFCIFICIIWVSWLSH